MSDELPLPRIPPSKAADAIFGPSRKRVRLDGITGSGTGSGPGAGSDGRGLHATHQLLLANSSDPAVFSSDDDPALDNYAPDPSGVARRRKKKRYVGAWFAQHPASTDSTFDEGEADEPAHGLRQGQREPLASPVRAKTLTLPLVSSPSRPLPSKKRPFERQFDSGVWMGRDGADNMSSMGSMDGMDDLDVLDGMSHDSDDAGEAAEADEGVGGSGGLPLSLSQSSTSTSSQLSLAPPPALPLQSDFPPPPPQRRRVFQRVPSLAVNTAEARARAIIQTCVEAGNEEVSLMSLDLTTLSDATVEPLSGLVPIPVVTPGVAFEQKEPSLKVFLSRNSLTTLPGALFRLEHLTVLTLRGNGLAELPPAIGQLRNLRSLNVALNALRYLPAELLPLLRASGQGGQLTEFLVHPNPYFAPEVRGDGGGAMPLPRGVHRAGDRPARVARSPVRYMDSAGKTWSRFTMEPAVLGVCNLVTTEDAETEPTPPWSTLPHRARAKTGAEGVEKGAFAETPEPLTASRVPTLVELALEACYAAPQLTQLADLLPDDAPPHLARQLAGAVARRDSGGLTCAVCCRHRPLIAPMTEWLEWWMFAKSDINASYASPSSAAVASTALPASSPVLSSAQPGEAVPENSSDSGDAPRWLAPDEMEMLPFVWRGCSWGCVPRAEKK